MRTRVLALSVASALALGACLPSLEQVSPDDSEPWPDGGEGIGISTGGGDVYEQEVVWSDCGQLECATIQVPLDWSDPEGATIGIAVNRLAAGNQDERIGSLLINPGGPGGSGMELTESFAFFGGDLLLEHYDVVGFDPRGVRLSAPINCGTDEELDAYFLADVTIETEADLNREIERTTAFAQRCRELTGPVIENIDTASAARDMDVIRAVLGDDKLHFLGFSYGTQLGANYATLYPENVGHMVLDGAVDFLLPAEDLSAGQAGGFELALERYIENCISTSNCPLPRDVDLAKREIRDIAIEARDEGFPSSAEDVNGQLMIYGIVVTLYDEGSWIYLSAALDEVITEGTADLFLQLANFYLDRNEDGEYQGNSTEAFTAISCLDEPDYPDITIDEYRQFERSIEQYSPTFGWWFASGVGCSGWPWNADTIVDDLGPAADAGPIVVIGTSGDPATPYEWAESLSDRLPNAALVTYIGDGHTAYGRSNQCIVDAIDAYFVNDVIPDSGLTC